MVSKRIKLLSFMLALMMILICAFATGVSVSAATSQSGDVVYFDNSITNYDKVYVYMWTDGSSSNAIWPGELMTKLTDNIWSYTIKGSYNKIIFTHGDSSGQSNDLDFGGNGMLATPNDNGRFNVTWSEYNGEGTFPTSGTQPSSNTESTSPTESSTPSETDEEYVVYCNNQAGWSKVNAYLWNSGDDTISSWPGVAMTNLGEGIFELKYNKSYKNIIFNDGSQQTADLSLPGNSYCYNNSTNKWEPYVASPVKITSFGTSMKSPCYTTCDIVISAEATSTKGDVTYKFTLSDSKSEIVLAEGASNSVVWVPTAAGLFTIKVEVTDTEGNSNLKTMDYEIIDVTSLIKPFIKDFSNSLGTTKEIEQNTSVVFTMDAIGGNTGTGLLFYKFSITEPDNARNIAYYTTSNTYSYTPTKIGEYTVSVSVQGSDNSTVTNTYIYECVENVSEETTVPTKILGDVNGDNVFSIKDVTTIQKHLARLVNLSAEVADIDKDGRISIKDATKLQLALAKFIVLE